jgi:hypothetical protein
MPEEKKEVKEAQASGQSANPSAADAEKVSLAAKVAELESKLAKETRDKENYRAGLLSKKEFEKRAKSEPLDLTDPSKAEEYIESKLQERELERKATEDASKESEERERLRKENDELRRSLEARSAAVGGISGGSGTSETESKPQGYWSDSQKDELRQIYATRGFYSSEQVEKMVARAEQIARSKTALAERNNDLTPTRKY